MKKLVLKSTPESEAVFASYPATVSDKMQFLKELVLETAEEINEIDTLEITLKWNEPSFVTTKGSTLRMDWKEKSPDQYALYFQCSSRLVDTFRLVFGNLFQYEGKRAIVFQLQQKIPVAEVKECIKAALRYHTVKHMETLGIDQS